LNGNGKPGKNRKRGRSREPRKNVKRAKSRKPRRAVLLGLDALVPNTTEKLMAEGILPNLAKLSERGVFSRMLPVIPAQTPTNWTTLATGATPGTHGVVQWGSHIPGEEVWEYHREEAFTAGLCRAEYLWEAAARSGRQSVVMNYCGYPPTTASAVFVDRLFQPARSYYDLAPATVYHTCSDLTGEDPIDLRPASGWTGVPPSVKPPLAAVVSVATSTRGTGPEYQLLVCASEKDYDTVLVCPGKDASKPCCRLNTGDWSDWLTAAFDTEDQGRAEGSFRFKLVELRGDSRRLRLYRTDAFPADGRICSDGELGRTLLAEFGPYVHAAHSVDLFMNDLIDWDTMDEIMADEAEWWAGAAEHAMRKSKADLLVLHWHVLDSTGHMYVQYIDPTGSSYRPEKAAHYWDIVRAFYRAADRFVGAFLRRMDDGNTVFAVASDHGMPANTRAVSLINLFKARGWVALTPDGREVDWSKSKVFFAQNHLWINLSGRDSGGIVSPEEYEPLRSAIIEAMRGIKDSTRGDHALAFVLRREDAPVVGLWGDHIGDVVYCYEGGFRWSGPEVLKMGEGRVVFPCHGGNHGPMMPSYETETTSVMATLILAGPGIRAGYRLPKLEQARISTTDLAPTLAWLLDLDPPAQSEGRILHEALEPFYSALPERQLVTTARRLVRRPRVRPKPIALQGDVTDEA